MYKKKRGQTWSIDLVLGVVIFILIIAVFYSLLSKDTGDQPARLQDKAELVANKLDADTGTDTQNAIIVNKQVDDTRVANLVVKYNAPDGYETIKKELGISEDFCIYLEDENGNLIPFKEGGNTYAGVGSGDIDIAGNNCGSTV